MADVESYRDVVNGLEIHSREWTGAQRPAGAGTVVLVHGLGSTSHIWDLTAPLLAEQFRVLGIDQRGHGESGQPDDGYDFASVTADLAGWLAARGVTEPVVVVGHSWGASVALQFGASYPDRAAGVALVDGGLSSPGERWSWEDALARLTPPEIDGRLWADMWVRSRERNRLADDARTEEAVKSLFLVDEEGRIKRRFRIPNHLKVVRALWEFPASETLNQVHCPVLALPARQPTDDPAHLASKIAAADRAVAAHPNVRVHWMEDSVHDVPLQRPGELAEELATFAASCFAGQGAPTSAVSTPV
jgi:pimeloyl-ACP methyl ester carboxylesterase